MLVIQSPTGRTTRMQLRQTAWKLPQYRQADRGKVLWTQISALGTKGSRGALWVVVGVAQPSQPQMIRWNGDDGRPDG